MVGTTQTGTAYSWPDGATWVFQGTVLEDATAGTHLSSLTVTPGAGNELDIRAFHITGGAATSVTQAFIDDGTNILVRLINTGGLSLTSGQTCTWPNADGLAAAAGNVHWLPSGAAILSGTMRLVLQMSTATVSVTQTFAVVARIKGAVPTATLADTVGVPTLTTNTNRVF